MEEDEQIAKLQGQGAFKASFKSIKGEPAQESFGIAKNNCARDREFKGDRELQLACMEGAKEGAITAGMQRSEFKVFWKREEK